MKNGDWAERKLLFLIYILIIESKIYSINKLAEKEGKKNLGWFKWFNGKLSMGWTNDQHWQQIDTLWIKMIKIKPKKRMKVTIHQIKKV